MKLSILDHLQFENPTVEQKNALLAMSAFVDENNSNDFLILCGAAGTGKSSITTALIGYLNAKNVDYNISAPTARASRLLGRKANVMSNTIHSLVFDTETSRDTGEVKFTPKNNMDDAYQIYIIDEASMISSKVISDNESLFKCDVSVLSTLISYVKQGNPKNKIIFLGDTYQLAPIHEEVSCALDKNYLESHFNLKGSIFYLTEVKRQADGSFVLREASKTRMAIENNLKQCQLNAFKFYNIGLAAKSYVKDYMANPKDTCISIAPSHNGNTLFNKIVRNTLFGDHSRKIEKGDWMIITQKWSRNGVALFSGDHVEVMEVNMDKTETVTGLHFCPIKLKAKALDGTEQIIEDYLLIESVDHPTGCVSLDFERALRGERMRKNNQYRESGFASDDRYCGAIRMTYGHSITCNKAQGGEWSKVYIGTMGIKSLKYQYTAITRAVDTLVLY